MSATELATRLSHALDPAAFAIEALGILPDPWQAGVLRSERKRLLMNCGRQTGKSLTAAILSLNLALYWPGSLTLLVSPSLRQSAELFRVVGELLGRLDVRPALTEDNKLSMTLENRSRVVSLPSTEATIRGYSGASLIVEDEAARVPDDLHVAIRPMLAVSGGRLILMSTPFGKRGHFFEAWARGQGWERMEVMARECPRIPPEFLAEARASMTQAQYRQEFECSFEDVAGQVFATDLIRAAMTDAVEPLFT